MSSYASTDRFSGEGGGSDAGEAYNISPGSSTLRHRRSFIEEGLLEGFRDNFEPEHMRGSEKINIKEIEESKVIIEKYR